MKYNEHLAIICFTIRRIRLQKGYSQQYMANKLGVSQNIFSKLELGVSRLLIEQLIAIADVLELDLNNLLKTNDLSFKYYQTQAETTKHIGGMPLNLLIGDANLNESDLGAMSFSV